MTNIHVFYPNLQPSASKNCLGPTLPNHLRRGSPRWRLARLQRLVLGQVCRRRQGAAKEAREKKERIIADVWHEIQRKRDMAGTRPPNPVPVKPRTGHAVTVPPVEPIARSEEKGEVRNGQGGQRKRKREANENRKNTAPPKQTGTDMQQHDSGCGTPASATDAGEFRYACPVCEGAVTSTVRTGQVWHRPCGRFRVKDGHVADRRFVYCCPFCGGNVASTVQTGQVNHRGICGNQFYVRDGRVSMETRQHRHKCPACGAAVWSARLSGRIHVTHATPSGKPCSTTRWQAERQA